MVGFISMYLIGFIGMLAHWVVGYKKGKLDLHIVAYLNTNRFATVKALTTLFVSILTLEQAGMVELTQQSFATIFLAGYAIDNMVNSEDTSNAS